MSVDSIEQDVSTKQQTSSRQARLQTEFLHSHAPEWKLPICVQALNLSRVAEVTEIQLASEDLVVVAAKCLADLTRESSMHVSNDQSAGDDAAMPSASSLAEKDHWPAWSQTKATKWHG